MHTSECVPARNATAVAVCYGNATAGADGRYRGAWNEGNEGRRWMERGTGRGERAKGRRGSGTVFHGVRTGRGELSYIRARSLVASVSVGTVRWKVATRLCRSEPRDKRVSFASGGSRRQPGPWALTHSYRERDV